MFGPGGILIGMMSSLVRSADEPMNVFLIS